jgi:Formin Homology 2 Domain
MENCFIALLTSSLCDSRDAGNLDSNSIKGLKELLATTDEKNGLLQYMKQAGNSEKEKEQAYADFSEAEKYMYTMLDVTDAEQKFDAMLFRSSFRSRLDELLESIQTIEKACDEIRNSDKLRTILAMILTVVNQINTGGEGNEAHGFTLDALLKLSEVSLLEVSFASGRFQCLITEFHFVGKGIRQENKCPSLRSQTSTKE